MRHPLLLREKVRDSGLLIVVAIFKANKGLY